MDLSPDEITKIENILITFYNKDIILNSIDIVLEIFYIDKINKYCDEINKILSIGDDGKLELKELIDILPVIKFIIEDSYKYISNINSNLDSDTKKFIKSNIEVISFVVVLISFFALKDKNIISTETLSTILTFIKGIFELKLNFKNKSNCLNCCC